MTTITRPALRLALLAVLAGGGAGCYHYVPVGPAAPDQGTPLRIHMERPASFELTAITAHNIGQMDAEMVREDGDELVVSALWLRAVTGQEYPGNGWTLRIDRGTVASVEQRSLNRWRTAAVFVGGIALSWLAFDALEGSSGGEGTIGGGGAPR